MTMNRRRFLLGAASASAAASMATPRARAEVPRHADIAVIGAGAAGLAATRSLIDAGYRVALIEARQRIGGRAFTETDTFGVPYDHGCHWLHSADRNPWTDYGKANGFTLYPASSEEVLFVGGRRASAAEATAADRARRAHWQAIAAAGRAGRDVSPASVIDDDGPWAAYARASIGAWSMGKDFDHFSCADWWSGAGGDDWFCREGFGALVAHAGRDTPVALNTAATEVDWSGPRPRVATSAGDISARAVIVTISTGALRGEVIRFRPTLPSEKLDSFERIAMGVYNHIALMFSEDVTGLGPDAYLAYQADSDAIMGVLANIGGTGLSFGYVGGAFGRELERAGVRAAVDFGLGEMRRIFGGAVDRAFVKGAYTRWSDDPWTLGAYASAEPGAYHLRAALRAPVAERLFFAGEACHPEFWATCGGAHLSGLATAREAARILGAPE